MTPRLVAAALVALMLPSLSPAARASAPAAAAFAAAESLGTAAPPAAASATPESTGAAVAVPPASAAPPASPFTRVPLGSTGPRQPHLGAYALMLAGVGLVGGSFAFEDQANRAYDAYLSATSATDIDRLFDRTTHYDHLSSGALIGGEVLFAAGLWMRFLHHPNEPRLSLLLRPDRCALALRF
jgi:hypothetical protein